MRRWTVDQSVSVYRDPPAWRRLMHNGMAEDFSWDEQVKRYEAVYTRLEG